MAIFRDAALWAGLLILLSCTASGCKTDLRAQMAGPPTMDAAEARVAAMRKAVQRWGKRPSTKRPVLTSDQIGTVLALFPSVDGVTAADLLVSRPGMAEEALPVVVAMFHESLGTRVPGTLSGGWRRGTNDEVAHLRKSCFVIFRSTGAMAKEAAKDLVDLMVRRELESEYAGSPGELEEIVATASVRDPKPLIAASKHDVPRVRFIACMTMGFMKGSGEVVGPALEMCLEDENKHVVDFAVGSLVRVGYSTPAGIKKLSERIRDEPDPRMRRRWRRWATQLESLNEKR